MSEKRHSEVAAVPDHVAIDLDDRVADKAPDLLHDEKSITNGTVETIDTFKPLEGVEPYDGHRILTVRALVTGAILGSTIACSNLYLGASLTMLLPGPGIKWTNFCFQDSRLVLVPTPPSLPPSLVSPFARVLKSQRWADTPLLLHLTLP